MPVVIPPTTVTSGPCAAAQEMVDAYIAAEKAVLKGQSWRWGDQSLTRADLPSIRAGRTEWEDKLAQCLKCQGASQTIGGLKVTLATFEGADGQGPGNGYSRNSGGCCG